MLSIGRPLHAETQRHVARCTGATDSYIEDLDLLIRGLIKEGLWDKLRLICVVAPTEADSLLDLKGDTDSVKVGSPAFVADRGFTTVSTTDYINTVKVATSGEGFWNYDQGVSVYYRNTLSGVLTACLMGMSDLNDVSSFVNIVLRCGGLGRETNAQAP